MNISAVRTALICGTYCLLAWPSLADARFLQVDPVGYDDQYNLYAYVGNDPVNLTDPTGRFRLKGGTQGEAERFVRTINPVSRTQYRVEPVYLGGRNEIRVDLAAQPSLSRSATLSSDMDAMISSPNNFIVDYANTVTDNGIRFSVDSDFGGG